MIRLSFALWRHDVAQRKFEALVAANRHLPITPRYIRRKKILQQRAERWSALAAILADRLGGD